jgi:hypothetical protein
VSDWGGSGVAAVADPVAAPAGAGSDWGGVRGAMGHKMGHVTTPFVDPRKKPAFDTSAQDATIVNEGVKNAQTVGGALGTFNRGLKANKAFLGEGFSPGHIDLGAGLQGAGRALWGNPQPGEEASNDVKTAAAISKIFHGLHIPDNSFTHGVYETGMDPFNLLSVPVSKGRTLMGMATDAAEGHGFNAAVQAGGAISKLPGGKAVTDTIAKAHDLLGVHSAAKRELARLHGAQWIDKYAEYRARLMQMGGKPDPALEAQAAKESAMVAPAAPKPKPPGNVPANVDPETGEYAPGVLGPATVDVNRILKKPATEARLTPAGTLPAGRVVDQPPFIPKGKTGRFAPQVGFGPKPKPKMSPSQAKAFYADVAAKKAAEAAKVAKPAFSPEDEKIFGLMTDPAHGGGGGKNALMDLASVPSDFLTGGMFIQPAGHIANISGLGAMSDLSAVGKAFGTGTKDNAKKLLGAVTGQRLGGGEDAASIAARHAGAQRGGAISTHVNERVNPLDSSLSGASSLALKVPVVGQALSLVPKAVRGLYRASGDILWKFDDEVKANRFQNLVDSGMEPNRAGLRVGGELVDYENKSPAARALRPVAPFSTWRTKAPLAVARNAVENPGKISAMNRLAPAAMGGTQGTDASSGQPYKSSLPGAEFNGLASSLPGAAKYATGTLGAIPSVGLDLAGALYAMQHARDNKRGRADEKKMRTFATYGQEPGTFLLNELPGLSQALQYGPGGMFNKGHAPSTINDLLSLLRVRPGTP